MTQVAHRISEGLYELLIKHASDLENCEIGLRYPIEIGVFSCAV